MRIRPLGMVAVTVTLVGLALAAVAFGPANPANLGSPTGGNTPQASSIGTPTWHVGDTWTYHVNSTPPDMFVAGSTAGRTSPSRNFAPPGAAAAGSPTQKKGARPLPLPTPFVPPPGGGGTYTSHPPL